MNRWVSYLRARVCPLVLGMVHVQPLPGTPRHSLKMTNIISTAVQEAEKYRNHGVDGLIVENMHDVPYICATSIGPEVISAMTVVCNEVRRACPHLPLGIQILAGCNKEALAVALATGPIGDESYLYSSALESFLTSMSRDNSRHQLGLMPWLDGYKLLVEEMFYLLLDCDFIRAECFIYSHVADEGLMNGCAGDLLRYRSAIGANHISILTDIKKKHSSHAITADVKIEQMARDAEFFLADGLIVTGDATGLSADLTQLTAVKQSVSIPVLVGSGVSAENVHEYSSADALIVGSYFKHEGKWNNTLDEKRIAALLSARDAL